MNKIFIYAKAYENKDFVHSSSIGLIYRASMHACYVIKHLWLCSVRRTTRPGYTGTTMKLQIVLNTPKYLYFNPRGVLGISNDRNDGMEPKVKTKKNP